MKDIKYVVIFIILGLALAYMVSGPLREADHEQPVVGTPLKKAEVYAKGTIDLAPELAEKTSGAPALFLVARPAEGGGPIAVKKFSAPRFPLSFSLTAGDHMMSGVPFYEGSLNLIARLDKDGVAGPRQPEDYQATAQVQQSSNREVQILISQ